MALTEAEIALATAQLAEAKSARHQLKMGKGVASWEDQNGEKVTYSKADIAGLDSYIRELEDLLGVKRDFSGNRPLRAFFR